jgi:hypothetical protein
MSGKLLPLPPTSPAVAAANLNVVGQGARDAKISTPELVTPSSPPVPPFKITPALYRFLKRQKNYKSLPFLCQHPPSAISGKVSYAQSIKLIGFILYTVCLSVSV